MCQHAVSSADRLSNADATPRCAGGGGRTTVAGRGSTPAAPPPPRLPLSAVLQRKSLYLKIGWTRPIAEFQCIQRVTEKILADENHHSLL